MSLLPAAVVAQVLSAGIGDRIEARAVFERDDRRLEAENSAYAAAALEYPELRLRLVYSPTVLLTPLERSPRALDLTHTIDGTAESNLTVYERARFVVGTQLRLAYRQEDYRRQLYGTSLPANTGAAPPPVPPGGPPSDASTSEAVRAGNVTTRYGSADASVSFMERLGRRSTLTESAGYATSIGLDEFSRTLYPFTHGPNASVRYVFVATPRDTLTTSLDGKLTIAPSIDGRAWESELEQRWLHLFSRRLSGDVSLGVEYTRAERLGNPPETAVYPTAEAGLSYGTRAAGGDLSLGIRLSYSPILDRTTLIFDPRVGVSGGVTWRKRRLYLYAATETTVSVSPEDPGSLSDARGRAGYVYDLGAGFSTDGGVRAIWQYYDGSTTIAPTWEVFLGLAWGYELL